MNAKQYQHVESQLFLVRLWSEQKDDGSPQWCGRVQHVIHGEVHFFCGCPQLIEILLSMMSRDVSQQLMEPSETYARHKQIGTQSLLNSP
jgi:hypothetical protein